MRSPQTVRGARGGESAATLDIWREVEITGRWRVVGTGAKAAEDEIPAPIAKARAGMLNLAIFVTLKDLT